MVGGGTGAPGVFAAQDAGGQLRGRHDGAELREPAATAEVSAAVRRGRRAQVHPGAGGILARSLRGRARHRQADRVRVRRARTDVDRRDGGLPERGAEGRARRRSHPHPRGHQRRRQGGQVHALRRAPEHPDQPGLRERRPDRRAGAAHPFPQGHQRRRQSRRAEGSQHRLGPGRHARGAVAAAVRSRQLHLGRRRLLGLQRRDQRQEVSVRAGGVQVQA